MVTTRTTSGTIKRPDYTYTALKLQGESGVDVEEPEPKRPPKTTNPRGKGKATSSDKSTQKVTGKGKGKGKPVEPEKVTKPPITGHDPQPLSKEDLKVVDFFRKNVEAAVPTTPDLSDGHSSGPPLSPVGFGGREEKGMSKIQRLDEDIRKWELIKENHVQHYPKAVVMIDATLEKLREERAGMEETEENTRVVDERKRQQVIEDRIGVLQNALASSDFEPERENIRASIVGYQSGDIGFAEHYTLIWKGKIVDRADTYADFTSDRQERLDRYANEYGPHWLWWERGLKIHPDSAPRAAPSVSLIRDISITGLGQYYLWQTYWKRHNWVARMPSLIGSAAARVPPGEETTFLTSPEGLVYCQKEGPRLIYRSILDSGATYPTLYKTDFEALGIRSNNYAAQAFETFITANGVINCRTYELFVTVISDTFADMVDPIDPVWGPPHPTYCGGLCPVATIIGEDGPAIQEDGFEENKRLSGLLPLLACYVQCSPTVNTLFLGEDRSDVLGLHRMPGQRRWDIVMDSTSPFATEFNLGTFGNPKVTFNHRNGQVVDQDRFWETHNSDITIDGGSFGGQMIVGHPGRQPVK